jgi:DNA repair protein RadC
MHNHPTGNLQPSENDLKITRRLVESGQVLDIPLYDHIIITRDSFYSFRDHGQIG